MGAPFCGWQLQPGMRTVQGELEQALEMLLRAPVRLTGAGRTDAGVHALSYVAHFDAARDDLHVDSSFIHKLNAVTPREIAVYRIISVPPDAHARFDAVSRTYNYIIATKKNPFTIDLAYHFYRRLDVAGMNEASAILPEYNDFTSFGKLHGNNKTNLCNVFDARWHDGHSGELRFVISANRFIRNMVRAVVGTMIEVGLGKYPPAEIRRIITEKKRSAAGASAPPQGLYLTEIKYPEMLKV